MNELTPASSTGSGTAKPAPERRVRHGLIEDWRDALGILSLLLMAAFSGALIARYWPDGDDSTSHIASDLGARMAAIEERLSQGKSSPEITALKERIAKLETRLRNAEIAMAGGAVGGDVAALGAAQLGQPAGPTLGTALSQLGTGSDAMRKLVNDIATRLTALEGKTATTPAELQAAKKTIGGLTTGFADLTAKIDTLGTRLVRIENSDVIALARRAALATAVANLVRASQGSSPFKIEYEAVASLLPSDAFLSAIAPVAARGLPTTGALIATFGNAADAAVDAERAAQAKDWSTRLATNFASLVSARATGETAGDSTEARVARAELRLKAGDLPAAVKELSSITGAARTPLKAWLADAAARVTLETMLATLNTRVVAALADPIGTNAADPVPQLPKP